MSPVLAKPFREMVEWARLYLAGEATFLHVYYSAHAAAFHMRLLGPCSALRRVAEEWQRQAERARNEYGEATLTKEEYRRHWAMGHEEDNREIVYPLTEEEFRKWLAKELLCE